MILNLSAKILVNWIVLTYLSVHCSSSGHIIDSAEMIDENKILNLDLVAVCQVSCLNKFLFNGEEKINPFWGIIDQCMERSECYMCYDFCEMLNEESRMVGKLMCTNFTCVSILHFFTNDQTLFKTNFLLKFPGCKYACVMHKLLPKEVLIN